MGRFRVLLAVLFLFLLFARPVSGRHTNGAGFDFVISDFTGGRI